jgi:uncharacterized Zn finger protein (UPF0148 family)
MSDPHCDKCGAPITTGMMVMICPRHEACEFWDETWDDELKEWVSSTTEEAT